MKIPLAPVTPGAVSAQARLAVGHKADTLAQLQGLLTAGVIDAHLCIAFEDWRHDPNACLDRIAGDLPTGPVIVRSCFSQEDSWSGSRAGAYLSCANVAIADRAALTDAIDAVFSSYPATANERVLIQHQVTAVRAAGVAMMRGMVRDAPYYVIEYDDVSGRTDTVTGGRAGSIHTLIVMRDRADACGDEVFSKILPVLREAESLAGFDRLEMEFAIDREGVVHVFQLRPMPPAQRQADDSHVADAITAAQAEFARRQPAAKPLLGHRALFGIMPDWNPAEIIGTAPRRLAFDLYRYLVTDGTWARQRAEFGYRDLGEWPLLADFAGRPYVDVRASFNSFLPSGLDEDLAGRLVNHYLDHLADHPVLHDKVEFEVAITCLAPDFADTAQRLAMAGFSQADIAQLRDALRPLTRHGWQRVPLAIQALQKLDTVRGQGRVPVRALLNVCRDFGVLPFAHLARCGFVATTILNGLVRAGVIAPAVRDAFMASLDTVASELIGDAEAVAAGTMPWNGFVAAYGHLRPDTYEITAPRYDQNAEKFLRPLAKLPAGARTVAPAFQWSQQEVQAIEQCLATLGLPDSIAAFDAFARGAIEGREKGKFLFSRLLSDALEDISQWGAASGVSREHLSHSRLADILAAMEGRLSADALRAGSEDEMRRHAVALALEMPALIVDAGDLLAFEEAESQPSFVGREDCIADCILVTGDMAPPRESISGRIVLVERADPGWDWLFGCGIAGLVTAFGGANSHIVVRAAELSLPSAIGVGEHRFGDLMQARRLRIAPGARVLEVLA